MKLTLKERIENILRINIHEAYRFKHHSDMKDKMGRCDECGANMKHDLQKPGQPYLCTRCGYENDETPMNQLSNLTV